MKSDSHHRWFAILNHSVQLLLVVILVGGILPEVFRRTGLRHEVGRCCVFTP